MTNEAPWETICRAADRIEWLAAGAIVTPWLATGATVWAGGDSEHRAAGCPTSRTAAWIATLSPAVAEPLVAWLRFEERDSRIVWETGGDTPSTARYLADRYGPALDFSRRVLGEEADRVQ